MMSRAVPDFVDRRMGASDARRLCEAAAVRLRIVPMIPAAAVPPPIFGKQKIFLSEYLRIEARPFVILHELAHVASGDADELVVEVLDERRYPVKDQVADAVAAIGVTSRKDRELPVDELAELLRRLVPVKSRAWTLYRSNDVAELVRQAPARRWLSA